MGKKDKSKKKGKGAEKTAAKTDKKLSNKLKKELEAIGEDDIENILAQIENEEKKRQQCVEKVIDQPTRRVNFTFIPHPDKDELILFGGEFFDGQKTYVYNDLIFYNVSANKWNLVKAPNGPPPRCGHQMVATSANKGQLWVFGGEFASPTQSQFYHYRDLWVYHLGSKQWEKINAQNGPSARSGHRMVLVKKQIFLFGGFHDNLRDYKYFNDVHCFDIETYRWVKVEVSGNAPPARSACCMVPLQEGKILIYGGYSKEKLKKDVDKGRVFTDSYILTPDKHDATGTKFKWVQTKMGGIHFPPRCSMPITSGPNNTAYAFGGVFDEEDAENDDISGHFFADLLLLDLDKLAWRNLTLAGKREAKSRRRIADEQPDIPEGNSEEVNDESMETTSTIVADDGVFKVTVAVGPSSQGIVAPSLGAHGENGVKLTQPSARINCGLAVKHGSLFLYGGMVEEGSRQITMQDFYSLDLRKLEEWRVIVEDDRKQEWLGSESEDGEEESDEEEEDEDEDEHEDESSGDEQMETC